GEGEPLILLHGGVVSTSPIWTGVPISYPSHMATLTARFRVIAPDTRGGGRTVHPGGTVTFDLLADDVAALADALGLERPLVAGFSEGGITATVLGIRHPGLRAGDLQPCRLRRLRPASPLHGNDATESRGQPRRDRSGSQCRRPLLLAVRRDARLVRTDE